MSIGRVASFVTPFSQSSIKLYHKTKNNNQATARSQICLSQSQSSQFDVTKPVFDLFSLRQVRGDALAKYNSLNQSEPLRINLWLLAALTLFSSPWLAVELNDEALPLAGVAVAVLAGLGSSALFFRECQRRGRQLTRIEKELTALSLPLRLPTNALADAPFQSPQALGTLVNKSSQTVRLIAVCGTAQQLQKALLPLKVLGRRLQQASTFVVAIPIDGSKPSDYGMEESRYAYVADAASLNQWKNYFDDLAPSNNEFRWFGISAIGRSFGSGSGSYPEWLQLLGQHLRPTDFLDETDASQPDLDGVLARQSAFYAALTEGNLKEMKKICSTEEAKEVSDIITQGGRLDQWNACLEEDARPAGMKIADADVLVVSDTLAYSTIVEFPVTAGLEEATLLAVQTWRRENAEDDWRLSLHQTIPWSAERPAGGLLLCDCRGCVALTRGPDRRTFGGLIG